MDKETRTSQAAERGRVIMKTVTILIPMDLAGQGELRRRGAEAGYAMAALIVGMAVLAVMMTVAMPVWKQMVQREKEVELVFRGEQIAGSIRMFQRKFANAYPPSLDVLVEQKFLRKKYKDPITGEDFVAPDPRLRHRLGDRADLHLQPRGTTPPTDGWARRRPRHQPVQPERRHAGRSSGGRHDRRDEQEQRHVDSPLQRALALQRMGVRLHAAGSGGRTRGCRWSRRRRWSRGCRQSRGAGAGGTGGANPFRGPNGPFGPGGPGGGGIGGGQGPARWRSRTAARRRRTGRTRHGRRAWTVPISNQSRPRTRALAHSRQLKTTGTGIWLSPRRETRDAPCASAPASPRPHPVRQKHEVAIAHGIDPHRRAREPDMTERRRRHPGRTRTSATSCPIQGRANCQEPRSCVVNGATRSERTAPDSRSPARRAERPARTPDAAAVPNSPACPATPPSAAA